MRVVRHYNVFYQKSSVTLSKLKFLAGNRLNFRNMLSKMFVEWYELSQTITINRIMQRYHKVQIAWHAEIRLRESRIKHTQDFLESGTMQLKLSIVI